MKKRLLCPSMMCAELDSIERVTTELDEAGFEMFHCDIMDGNFVPNMALSPYDVAAIRRHTKKPIDLHLMVKNPELIADIFIKIGVDIIYFHAETTLDPEGLIEKLRRNGVIPGLAISPSTEISSIKDLISKVDYVLLMTVQQGFAGQKFIDEMTNKIPELLNIKKEKELVILVDGAISPIKISELSKIGVDGFVLGTSALFGKGDYKKIYNDLKG